MSPDNSTAGSFRLTPWNFLPVSDPNEKKPDYLEWLTKVAESPFVLLNETGEVLRAHDVLYTEVAVEVSTLDSDETWNEHPRDLTWLTEMEVLAYVSS